MWGIQGKEGSISETLFQDQVGLLTVNTSDIHTSAKTRLLTEWPLSLFNSTGGSIKAWMASMVENRVLWVAMSRWASNHTGTRVHLQRVNVVQDAFCQFAMRHLDNFLRISGSNTKKYISPFHGFSLHPQKN
jgi:hypothetical protein